MLIAIGKLKESWAREAFALYADRLRHALKFELVELPSSKEKDPARQCEDESQRILHHLQAAEGKVFVLDERGTAMMSQQFSDVIAQARDRGEPMTFVLGGAYGLTDAVKKYAHRILRLSDMTLPHELCRVVFLEQLYRATEIAKGSGYHHESVPRYKNVSSFFHPA